MRRRMSRVRHRYGVGRPTMADDLDGRWREVYVPVARARLIEQGVNVCPRCGGGPGQLLEHRCVCGGVR